VSDSVHVLPPHIIIHHNHSNLGLRHKALLNFCIIKTTTVCNASSSSLLMNMILLLADIGVLAVSTAYSIRTTEERQERQCDE